MSLSLTPSNTGCLDGKVLDAGRSPAQAPLYYLMLDKAVKSSAIISGFKISSQYTAGHAINPFVHLLFITALLAPAQTLKKEPQK